MCSKAAGFAPGGFVVLKGFYDDVVHRTGCVLKWP